MLMKNDRKNGKGIVTIAIGAGTYMKLFIEDGFDMVSPISLIGMTQA